MYTLNSFQIFNLKKCVNLSKFHTSWQKEQLIAHQSQSIVFLISKYNPNETLKTKECTLIKFEIVNYTKYHHFFIKKASIIIQLCRVSHSAFICCCYINYL